MKLERERSLRELPRVGIFRANAGPTSAQVEMDSTSRPACSSGAELSTRSTCESISNIDQSQQQLLIAYIFEFPADDVLRLKERMPLLEEVGVFLAEYGRTNLSLGISDLDGRGGNQVGYHEMCDMLLLTKEVSIKKYRELAIMMACKRSIKSQSSSMTTQPNNFSISSLNVTTLTTVRTDVCLVPFYQVRHGKMLIAFRKYTSLRELGKY